VLVTDSSTEQNDSKQNLPQQPPDGVGNVLPQGAQPMQGMPGYVPGQPTADPNQNPAQPQPSPTENSSPVASATDSGPALSQEEALHGVKISEERISLDLKGIDINDLFRILSLKMGVTIVPSKSVTGRINIFLNNLTFDDVLDVILISQDLASDRKGNIINIMTSAEYERLYGDKYNEKRKFSAFKLKYAKPSTVFNALSQLKSAIGKVIVDEASGTIMLIDVPDKISLMEKTAKDLDGMPQTEIFDIKYAKASDLKTQISAAVTQGSGEVFVDERSGKVVVTDLPDKMKKIKRMLKAFDAETKEVYIEAEVLQVTLKKEYQRQINWEKLFRDQWMQGLDFKGTFPVNPSFTPSPGLSTTNLTITMGTVTSDKHTETYKFLETLGDVKIISSPRLLVVHGQEAKIMVGSREAYVTTSQSQAQTTTVTSESVQFIDVGTKLNLTPLINEDGFITMKIKPEISSVRETLTTTLGSKIPIVETSEAETMVKVKDSNTIMIAGLIKQERRKDTTGWPFLQSIPIIGAFFGSRAELNKRTEVVILITPHIMRGDRMLAGTEPEKVISADIVPEQTQKDILSRFVDKEIEKATASERQKIGAEKQSVAPSDEEKPEINVEGKIKGLEKY
jgi:type II secretory pathway component GspD/PulD (secretin)